MNKRPCRLTCHVRAISRLRKNVRPHTALNEAKRHFRIQFQPGTAAHVQFVSGCMCSHDYVAGRPSKSLVRKLRHQLEASKRQISSIRQAFERFICLMETKQAIQTQGSGPRSSNGPRVFGGFSRAGKVSPRLLSSFGIDKSGKSSCRKHRQ